MSSFEIYLLVLSPVVTAFVALIAVFAQYKTNKLNANILRRFEAQMRKSEYRYKWRDEYTHHGPYFNLATEQLYAIIRDAAETNGITLTWAAYELLTIPVVEEIERRPDVDWGDIQKSISTIMQEMTHGRRESSKIWNAQSIIYGFYKSFCRIPPFCNRHEHEA